jgi:hypothetical protein
METNYILCLKNVAKGLVDKFHISTTSALDILSMLLHCRNYSDLLHSFPLTPVIDFNELSFISRRFAINRIDQFESVLFDLLNSPPFIFEKMKLLGRYELIDAVKVLSQDYESEKSCYYNLVYYPFYQISLRKVKPKLLSRAINKYNCFTVRINTRYCLVLNGFEDSSKLSFSKEVDIFSGLFNECAQMNNSIPLFVCGTCFIDLIPYLLGNSEFVLFDPWELYITSKRIFCSGNNKIIQTNKPKNSIEEYYNFLLEDLLCASYLRAIGAPDRFKLMDN